jgi:membrane protease YdiL (CAAX protease family)
LFYKEIIMTTIRAFIERQATLAYFVLTFAITWGCMALAIGPGGFPITAEQFETAGPLVYTAMLVGPSLAGILLTGLVHGKAGLRELWSRLIKWRVNPRWYALALLAAPLLATAILLALSLISSELLPAITTSGDKPTLLLTGIAVGLVVGIFEELGWTGFAIPRMRLRHSALTTGITVGLLWGAWHFLVFWESDSFSGAIPLALLLARLFAWLPPYRVIMVWVYDRTGSLLVSILLHASLVFNMNVIVPPELSGSALWTWILVWAAVLWVIVAVVAVANRRRFSPQPARRLVA